MLFFIFYLKFSSILYLRLTEPGHLQVICRLRTK